MNNYIDLHNAIEGTTKIFRTYATPVHTEKWQGVEIGNKPEMQTYEITHYHFRCKMGANKPLSYYQEQIKPNLPWADDHFQERISGQPLNPGREWENWPYSKSADRFRDEHGQFNHSYMERLWPKYAGMTDKGEVDEEMILSPRIGIRWEYGDLNSLISLLIKEPLTRQAWIPLFFPEDTGIADGGRKPCTLGYQFLVRNNRMSIFYPLRSCDLIRHFRDDIYLAVRLGLWVIERCRQSSKVWEDIELGDYSMYCSSLHVFKNDWLILNR